MSAFEVVPASLHWPARAASVAAEALSGVARSLRHQVVETGRVDSGEAVAQLLGTLAADADVLAQDASADADAVRTAASRYVSTDRMLMGR